MERSPPADEQNVSAASRRRHSAFAVLVRRARVLIVRARGRRRWSLPGGRLDPGEAPRRGAAREVAEETGLSITVGELVGAYLRSDGSYALVFLATAAEGAEPVGPVNEIAAQRWVSRRKALRLLGRSARRRLREALARHDEAAAAPRRRRTGLRTG